MSRCRVLLAGLVLALAAGCGGGGPDVQPPREAVPKLNPATYPPPEGEFVPLDQQGGP